MEWIKTTDKLPDKIEGQEFSHHVLCENKHCIFTGFYLHQCGEWMNAFNKESDVQVDYWMPLPESAYNKIISKKLNMKTEIDYVVKQHVRNGMIVLGKYTDRMKMLYDNPNVDKTKFFVIEDEQTFNRYNEVDGKEMIWSEMPDISTLEIKDK